MNPSSIVNKSPRLISIDMVRGLVMVFMALDHCRDFFYDGNSVNPLDPNQSNTLLYLTRWITHTCAPSFVFLAGISIFFQKESQNNNLVWKLFSRGVWLIFLEVTLINFSWTFHGLFQNVFLQIIWALGAGFICMSLLHKLPHRIALILGLAIITLQSNLNGIKLNGEGFLGVIWSFAYEMVYFKTQGGCNISVPYPFLPWLGILLAGFGCGPYFQSAFSPEKRQKGFLLIAIVLATSFAIIRSFNGFGNPAQWHGIPGSKEFFYTFFDVEKYPPSMLYCMVTLSVLAIYLWLAEKSLLPIQSVLLTFGRVPLFFYFFHLPLIHGSSMLCFHLMKVLKLAPESEHPGFELPGLYIAWILVLLTLLPFCRWFEGLKARNRGAWWTTYS